MILHFIHPSSSQDFTHDVIASESPILRSMHPVLYQSLGKQYVFILQGLDVSGRNLPENRPLPVLSDIHVVLPDL